tara:strand:+ start:643 stop:861 length:219 start_codon:yes stop_codon:yes gene_type:complete
MLRGVVVRVVVMVIWHLCLARPIEGVLEVFTVVVLVQVMAAVQLPQMVGTGEMGRFVLSGARVVRFLRTQLK